MSNAPLILLSHSMLAPVEFALTAAGYRVAKGWELQEEQKAEVRAIVHAGEFVLTPDFLKSLPQLGLIANISAGYDGVNVPWCRENGIEVTHSQGGNADDVADQAMGLLIGAWRDIVKGDRVVREGRWNNADRMGPRPGLSGRKVGIMGLGYIGKAVARRCEAFDMKVSWWGPNPKPEITWPRAETLLDLATDCDILVVACRADVSNRGAVSEAVIKAVGSRGMIVNVSRGSVIDEDALIAALKAGELGRAALDVFAQEPTPPERWADVPNTVLTPHTAGGTVDSIPRMVAQALENVRLFLAGEPVITPAV